MPELTQWTIRAALVYLLIGFTLGALLLTHKGIPFYPAMWRWLPVHIEFLLMGWVAQVTMGVGFYIAPRFWQQPRRGNETGAWAAFILLNTGIWLVALGAILRAPALVTFLGRAAEAGSAVAFVSHIWFRIVSREG